MPTTWEDFKKSLGVKNAKKKRTKKQKEPVAVKVIAGPKRAITAGKLSPFGNMKTANFRYVTDVSITSGGLCGVNTFTLNSMWRPDFTGGILSHQANFRDSFSLIYARYRVNTVSYKITSLSNNVSNFQFGIMFSQDSAYNPALATFSENLEKRNITQWKQNLVYGSIPSSIKGVAKCHSVAGVTKSAYHNERNYSGAVGSDPLLPLFMHLICYETSGAAMTQKFMVELSFNTTYYEPKVQPQN